MNFPVPKTRVGDPFTEDLTAGNLYAGNGVFEKRDSMVLQKYRKHAIILQYP